jgi:hypothetical protein
MNLVSKASFHRFDIVVQQDMMKEDVSPSFHVFVHREPSPSKIAHFIGIFRLPFTAVILFYTTKYKVKVKGRM